MPGRSRMRFKGSGSRGGSGSGSLLGNLFGGGVSPVDSGDIPNDSSYDANVHQIYQADHPVLDAIFNRGANAANAQNLNQSYNLLDTQTLLAQRKAKELQDYMQKKALEEAILKHGLKSAEDYDTNEYSKEQENLKSRNDVLKAIGLLPSDDNAVSAQAFTAYPAVQAARAGYQQKESDAMRKMAENRSADVLRPLQLEQDVSAAQANVDNSVPLNAARIADMLLKPKVTEAEIALKNKQAQDVWKSFGLGDTGIYNGITGVQKPLTGSVMDQAKSAIFGNPITAPAMTLNTGQVPSTIPSITNTSTNQGGGIPRTAPINAILNAIGLGSTPKPNPTPLNPNPNYSRAMDYNPSTFGIKSNLSGTYSPFGNSDAPVSVPNSSNVTGIAAAPTTLAGPLNPIVTKDAMGNVYINGILQKKKTTNASPAVSQ